MVSLCLLKQPVGDLVRSVLGRCGHLSSVGTGHLDRRDRLADDEEVLHLPDVKARRAVDGDPMRSRKDAGPVSPVLQVQWAGTHLLDDEEVRRRGLVLEERCLDEVVVQRLLGLTLIHRCKRRVRRFILRIQNKRFSELELSKKRRQCSRKECGRKEWQPTLGM